MALGPQVKVAQRMLADQILSVEQANPYSLVIVLGNFNIIARQRGIYLWQGGALNIYES